MSTITALVGGDGITNANSMTKINTNFSNLNTDKIETSVLDTDTTLAANSDSKVATQKAVKTYVDAGGNVNASTTAKGIVEEATQAEVDAGTAVGATGARLFVNPSTTGRVASTTVQGVVEEATQAEVDAGTAAGGTGARLFVNPSTLTSLNFVQGPVSPTYVKTYHNFVIPMIGTSAAPVVGAWVASSAETIFTNAGSFDMSGTGDERVTLTSFAQVFGVAGGNGSRTRFDDTNVLIMDWWAVLPTSSVDTIGGFCDAATSLTITYNQTAQEAIAFTTNNGNLYAHTCTGAAATTTAIAAVTVSAVHNYRIEADLGANTAYFYVDGVLKATLTTNFPTSTQQVQVIIGRSATGQMNASNPSFAVEKQ